MAKDVTDKATMRELQGDKVLVVSDDRPEQLLLTIVRVIDVGGQSLILVDRQEKGRPSWDLSQVTLNQMVPHTDPKKDPQLKWLLKLN